MYVLCNFPLSSKVQKNKKLQEKKKNIRGDNIDEVGVGQVLAPAALAITSFLLSSSLQGA